ncbi:hypothetical protein HIM_12308 [Hirsutella minnesotensis 3608]|uniref:HTH CENPB-type domain-containing protein n=1 Tax=Hirsutella minnesotensis 3608 TaxID=1043627 RepID=A0A0F7ZI66_9HYPO|nr:hypothetical protein HIM_12308 [Hirsutella minnesotensis 3608]
MARQTEHHDGNGRPMVPREERVLLAVRAYQQGQFKSTRKAAAAYDVPQSTVSDRLRGVIRRRDAQMNNLKLTATEETALVQWILSMDERGMPPTVAYTRRMANLLLSERGKDPVGENWVRKFVGRHGEIKAKYSRRYDYQRAKCEDPQKIQGCLFPFDPNRILSRLQVQVDKVGNDHGDKNTPSPNKSLEAAKTPYNVNQLTTHAERLLQRRPQNTDSPVSQAINQLIKGCQMAMHSAALLADENRQLRSENQRRKQRKEQRREYIGDGGTLSVAEGTVRIKQRREEEEEEEEQVKRRRVEEEERPKRRHEGEERAERRREKEEERAKRRQEGEERAKRRRQENEEWFKLRREREEERDQRLIEEELSVPRQRAPPRCNSPNRVTCLLE